jgi:Tfp pilus assembly PilM family ATPase
VRLWSEIFNLPIGVDIGGRRIKAVQLKGSPGRWGISAAGCIMRENPGGPVERADIVQLRDMVIKDSFKGRRVILSVPFNELLTGIMELPPRSSGAPLDELARIELARMHRCEPDSFEIACWDLPAPARAGGATHVMAAGFSHEKANALVDIVEAEGLEICALDICASAISRACTPLLEGVTGIAAILDLGWDQADLILLYQDVIVYERKLVKGGIGSVVDSLGRELKVHHEKAEHLIWNVGLAPGCDNVTPAYCKAINQAVSTYCESLVEEMQIPLSYLSNQYPDASPETLLLVGGGGRIPGIERQLDSVLEFYVRTVLPGDIVKCSAEIEKKFSTSLAAAAGMGQFSEKNK